MYSFINLALVFNEVVLDNMQQQFIFLDRHENVMNPSARKLVTRHLCKTIDVWFID